ncbi:MAG: dihydroneopterin aldolase [Synergistaceae bacterium]|jgi:dihydroneopterin aldolase|nr:dihydroneopterin aldolase [Synergistaceae bacterium]
MKCKHAVKGMSFHAFHGVLEVERELGQVFSVDVTVEFDGDPSDVNPKAEPFVRDADIYEISRNVMMETKYTSVISLAAKIAHDVMTEYARAVNAVVSVTRKQLFIPGSVDKSVAEVSCGRADLTPPRKSKPRHE